MKRFKRFLVTGTVALAGLGVVAGTAAASSSANGSPKAEVVGTIDPDTVQSGDQTSPDAAALSTSSAPNESSGEAPESSGEAPEGVSDGPGGHADAPGQNVDYQFEGEE